jgi:dipeptidyl aminopeptidase/acylaminoacyl peptidase
LTTKAENLIRQGHEETNEWLVDDSGEIVAEQDYVEKDRRWSIRLFRDGHPRQTVSGIAPIDPPDILGLSASGDAILVALTGSDGISWNPLSIKDGTWGPEIGRNEALSDVLLKDGSRRMIATAFVGDETRYHFADPSLQEGWDWIVRVFGFQRVEFVSVSADHTKVLVQVMGSKSGFGYYLADVKEHLTLSIGKIYEGVAQIAEVKPIKYPAADGLEIPAYLTLPPERPAKNLPVVVLPHGGPQARDSLGFDWWAQALAAQGYAVLQPNYRGSDLGQKWVESAYGEWGRKMQTDLSDGLRYLAAQGIVDPKRACIVGASYGGYAALAGVALQSDIYRCAVSVAGISDPANFIRWVTRKEAYGNQLGLRYWERFLGVGDPHDKRLDAISPLRHADQITVPLLLIHGRDDTTVPYDQSADLVKALKHAGKPAEFVTLDKEDHYLSHSATRLQMLQSSIEFLRTYNPPD